MNKNDEVYVSPLKPICNRPPMGWNSWSCFGTDINETKIKEIVEALLLHKLDTYGYEYIILDDGWMTMHRSPDGQLVADPIKFPSGMKALGDYIHSKGLKFGIYTSVGRKTCEGYPGSFGYEQVDTDTFAEWGVDYIKIDWCTYKHLWWPFWNYKTRYEIFSDAITMNERPMIIAFCNWGFGKPWEWGMSHTFRITFDTLPTKYSIRYVVEMSRRLEYISKPNGWIDLDALEIGNGISQDLARFQFYWWCMLKSPLIIGCDLRYIHQEDLDIITNMDLIRQNQGY